MERFGTLVLILLNLRSEIKELLMPAPLPWRKLPRDLMVKPEIQFIIKRLPAEKKHAVFTVLTALYCYADDSGIVDITDQELFTDICLFDSPEELFEILDRLEARKIITHVAPEGYQIEGWDPPLGYGTQRTAGETWGDRMQRTASASRRAPDEPTPAELAALAMGDDYPTPEPAAAPAPAPAPAPTVDSRSAKPRRRLKKNQNDTETKNVSVSQSLEEIRGDERRVDKRRGEERRPEETRTHTQITAPAGDGPAALVGLRPPCDGDGPPPGRAEGPPTRFETDQSPLRPKESEPPDERRPEKTGTETRAATAEGDRNSARAEDSVVTDSLTVTDTYVGTAEITSPAGTDEDTATGEGADTDDKADWLWNEVKGRIPPEGIPGLELEKPFKAFSTYFKRQNPGGYANPEREIDAIFALSVRAYGLGNKNTPPEIVACTMAGLFQRIINQGGYFEGMPCTASMLIKPGNYQKVLDRLSKTMYPRGNTPGSWKREHERLAEEAEKIKKETENEVPAEVIALSYEKFGIDPEDPDRFVKLRAAQKASGE